MTVAVLDDFVLGGSVFMRFSKAISWNDELCFSCFTELQNLFTT